MKIEHVAWQVPAPVETAQWYIQHLGLKLVRKFGAPAHGHFLADDSGQTVIEIYNNPKASVPDYRKMSSLHLHLAFVVDDVAATRDRLVKAGAKVEDALTVTPDGDQLAMLRDPWGLAIQLVKRAKPLGT